VVIHLDEHKLKGLLAGVPRAMLSRRVNEMEQNAKEYGIRTLTSGNGFVRADISGANRNYLLTWLNAHSACVDIEPSDVETLMGRSIDSLVVMRWLQNGGGKLTSITPDEIMESLDTMAVRLQTTLVSTGDFQADELQDAIRAQAEEDLVNSGLVPAGKGLGESLEPQTPAEPRIGFEFRDEPEVDFMDPFSPASRGAGFEVW
jgi:hypothetical protein